MRAPGFFTFYLHSPRYMREKIMFERERIITRAERRARRMFNKYLPEIRTYIFFSLRSEKKSR